MKLLEKGTLLAALVAASVLTLAGIGVVTTAYADRPIPGDIPRGHTVKTAAVEHACGPNADFLRHGICRYSTFDTEELEGLCPSGTTFDSDFDDCKSRPGRN